MPRTDEPNLTLPLATSIIERGIAGYTHSVTNAEDQRKLNCMYEVSKNAMTGKGTLTLSKRPGVTVDSTSYGSSSQLSYLILDFEPRVPPNNRMVFNILSGDIRSSTLYGNITILASAAAYTYLPAYADSTSLSTVKNAVIQLLAWAGVPVFVPVFLQQRTFFITDLDVALNNPWTEIVDADFTTLFHRGKMEHMDGYAFILDRNNVIWNSDINSLANWTATSFLAKSIQQDIAVGLARLGTRLLAFSANSVEVFYNAGNTVGSPLGRIPQLSTNIGLIPTVRDAATAATGGGTHYYATLENKIYFVGRKAGITSSSGLYSDAPSSAGMYSFDGQNFDKVSSSYIDKILSEKSHSIYSVNTIGFSGQAGIAVCFTAPSATSQRFLVFCPEWKEWFEWTSTIFSPVNGRGYHLGIVQPQKLFTFSPSDNWQDNAVSYAWSTQFKLPANGASKKFLRMYGVEADTARSANDLTVEISRDDCQTFETLTPIDLTQERKMQFRGGSFRGAHIRLGNTNAVETRIQNFLARVE